MKTKWMAEISKYTGAELKPLFAYMKFGILGDSIVAWRGPCDVQLQHMVDGEDRRESAQICGDDMVHFIVEFFPASLIAGVLAQRLLAGLAKDVLSEMAVSSLRTDGTGIRRDGDDLYVSDRKLSISIASVSAVSTMIHFAINVSQSGTPVPTLGLEDVKVSPEAFANELLHRFSREWTTTVDATTKVFPL